MRINRFYTPSLPQYTTQFVEDQTPWDQMIGLENLKLERSDQAMEKADEMNSSLAQIIPGARTGPIAEQLKQEYSQKIADWTQKHKDDSYSAPAIRELTQINSMWKQDQRLPYIIQDREETQLYRKDRATMDNRDIDPNVDPETGDVIPIDINAPYQGFKPILRAAPFEQQLLTDLKSLDIKDDSGQKFKTVKDPETGQSIRGLVNYKSSVRGDDIMDPALENIADRIVKGTYTNSGWVKAMVGEDATKEDILNYLSPYKKQAYVNDYTEGNLNILDAAEDDEKEEIRDPFDNPPINLLSGAVDESPASKTMINGKGVGPTGQNKRQFKRVERTEDKIDPEWYSIASDKEGVIFPELLTQKDMTLKLPGNMRRVGSVDIPTKKVLDPFEKWSDYSQLDKAGAAIYESLSNNYAGTKAKLQDYYTRYANEAEFKEAGETGEFSNYVQIAKSLDNIFDKYDKSRGYDEPDENIFKTELNKNAVRYAVDYSGALAQDPNAPFEGDTPEERRSSFLSTPMEEYDNEQQIWVSKIAQNYATSKRNRALLSEGIQMDQEDKDLIKSLYIGDTSPSSPNIPQGNVPDAFRAARIVPVYKADKKKQNLVGKDLSQNEKDKIFKDAKDDKQEINIGEWIDPKASPWGAGMFRVTIGPDIYSVEAPSQYVEPDRLLNNIGSYRFPSNLGNGNIFVVDGYKPHPIREGDYYADVKDKWNWDDEEIDKPNAIWMQTQEDVSNGTINLLIYNQDPRGIDDLEITPEDYKKYPLVSTSDPSITPDDLEMLIDFHYNGQMLERLQNLYEANPSPELKKSINKQGTYLMYMQQLHPDLIDFTSNEIK